LIGNEIGSPDLIRRTILDHAFTIAH